MWKVLDSHRCAHTGTKFTCVQNKESNKILIWYAGNLILKPGDIVIPISNNKGLVVNGELTEIKILHIAKFKAELWFKLCCKANAIFY